MGRLPVRARAYLLFILGCALLLLLDANPLASPPSRETLAVCLVAGLGLVFAYTNIIELSHSTKVNVATALEFALLLIVGVAYTIWTIAFAFLVIAPWRMRRAWRWYTISFSAANTLLSIGVAGLVFSFTAGDAPLMTSSASVLAVLMAGATYFFLNVGIVAGMVSVSKSSDSVSNILGSFQLAAPQFIGLLALGLVGAAVYASSPAAAVLLLIPLIGVYTSLRSALGLRAETKRALELLAIQVDQYHPYTSEHSSRVAEYSGKIARAMLLSSDQVDIITRAARIHDLGKLGIYQDMLNKPSGLSKEEMEEVRTHPARGAELVSRFADYRNGRDLILHHHEQYDGTGYPYGLKGDEIPQGARIIAVADAVDAMLSDRPYRKARSVQAAMKELVKNRGKQFDPTIVDVVLSILEAEAGVEARPVLAPATATL